MSILLRINRKSPPGLFTLLTVVNKETGRKTKRFVGGYSMEAPPLPIPNREVKLHSADGTAVWWESRSLPTPHNLGPFICLNGPLFVYSRLFCILDNSIVPFYILFSYFLSKFVIGQK